MIIKTNEIMGKNLLNTNTKVADSFVNTDGRIHHANNRAFAYEQFIELDDRPLYLHFYDMGYSIPSYGIYLRYYNENKIYIGRLEAYRNQFDINLKDRFPNAKYVRISASNDTRMTVNPNGNFLLSYSNETIEYEPFKGYKSYMTADSDKLMEEMN